MADTETEQINETDLSKYNILHILLLLPIFLYKHIKTILI